MTSLVYRIRVYLITGSRKEHNVPAKPRISIACLDTQQTRFLYLRIIIPLRTHRML